MQNQRVDSISLLFKMRCLSYGGHLAVFETLDELLLMSEDLKKRNDRNFYIIYVFFFGGGGFLA